MSVFSKGFVFVILCFAQQHVYSAAYYIDSRFGKDLWSGKLAAPTASPLPDGPWQSLNRLSSASLAPGDTVQLQCGSKWTQTLRINKSGTPDLPIIIRSAPACDVPPSIDGGYSIEANGWARHSGAIYKASWPPQKFQNGSLASDVTGWTSWSLTSDEKLLFAANCPGSTTGCASFSSSVQSTDSIATSNRFMVEGGITYSGEITLRIPRGINVKVLVRRGSPPYEPISAVQWVTGTEAWQKVNITFVSPYTVADARLDMEVHSSSVTIYFKDASLKPAFPSPAGAWVDDKGLPLLVAHHPNRGYDSTQPDSPYAVARSDGNVVNSPYGYGSTFIDIDATLGLPKGTMIRPGNWLRVRTQPWRLDEVKITQVQGNRLFFEAATSHPIKAGQGFFLLGALGMLDSPGEWAYDDATNSAYAWMPDSTNPSGRVRLSVLDKGIDLSGKSNVIVQGVDVRYVGIGIDLTNTKNIRIRGASITNTIGEGILGLKANNVSIASSQIRQSGGDAVSARDSVGVSVIDNDIDQSGVILDGRRIWSLPAPATAAIFTGSSSTITGNRIRDTAYDGIWPAGNGIGNGIVEGNVIMDSCLQLNDCGAIYVNALASNTRISSNLIERASGNIVGLGPTARTHAVGIYLDERSTGVTVENNTVTGADHGIQLHNAFNNLVTGNKLLGNRRSQLFMQEDTRQVRAEGDLHDNRIEANILVPDMPAISLLKKSDLGLTNAFGSFERNHYSALLYDRVIGDSPSNAQYVELRFDEWQAIRNIGGNVPDSTGSATYSAGYAVSKIASGNIIPNGKLAAGSTGWWSWNTVAPRGQLKLESCPVGPCLQYSAGASEGIVVSPNFSLQAELWYRVSFDAKADAGQVFTVIVRRDSTGTDGDYEWLMVRPEVLSGNSAWKRYSFSFKAGKTVLANPVTGERGARLDFGAISAGKSLTVANLEIVATQASDTGLNLRMISNSTRDEIDAPCPDEDSTSIQCANYVRFSDRTAITWPLRLLPLESEIIFTTDPTLIDTDSDGIANFQDNCPGTNKGEITDAVGCSLEQIMSKS